MPSPRSPRYSNNSQCQGEWDIVCALNWMAAAGQKVLVSICFFSVESVSWAGQLYGGKTHELSESSLNLPHGHKSDTAGKSQGNESLHAW